MSLSIGEEGRTMKKLVAFSTFALLLACGDGLVTPDQGPAAELGLPDAAAVQSLLGLEPGEKWSFASQLTFVGTVDPGDQQVNAGGVLHIRGLVNEFAMTGDLVGSWFFQGDAHINLNDGRGRSIASPALLEITSPGVGTFECPATGKLEFFPTDDFIQYGNHSGCHGTGDFEGLRMRAWISNEANPGTGGDTVYDLWGEIW
jgi:hypothetical protein